MSRQDKPQTMNKQDMVGIALEREAKGRMIKLRDKLNEMIMTSCEMSQIDENRHPFKSVKQ
jgi:hypothetical protein